MPELREMSPKTTSELADATFADLGCTDYGVVVLGGATSWGTHETGTLTLPCRDGILELRIAYDEREAPYVVDECGRERQDVLVSLSDEGTCLACAWAIVGDESPLLGVGIDLAETRDFDDRSVAQQFIKLLFCEREHELVRAGWPTAPSMGYATAFGAKEAAFKACARPLRAWYDTHDEELSFDIRHFSLVEAHTARGEQRNGAAQKAMDRMGIARMDVQYAVVDGKALVVATARA